MDPIPKSLLRDKLRARDRSLGYSEGTIRRRCCRLSQLLKYMDSHAIDNYTPEIGARFLNEYCALETTSECSRKNTPWIIAVLDEIYEGAEPRFRKKHIVHPMYGAMAAIAEEFIIYQRDVRRLSKKTIASKRFILSRFTQRMEIDGIGWSNLRYNHIVEFLSSQINRTAEVCATIKNFMRHAHANGLTSENFGEQLKSIKPHRGEKLPTYYSPEEVAKVEASIDRRSATGKRDYAIILLASRLGLRSSDICRLEFKNLDWDKSEISLVQYKTGKPIRLPLLSDVGDAIIDYIRNGRPYCNIKTIFLTRNHPYRPCENTTISSIVKRYFYKSGVNCKGKKKGPHALRHSLATAMLGEGTILSVISGSLGHESTESTMYYLGVDVTSLLQCSLNVPPVDENFYIQKGGILYE